MYELTWLNGNLKPLKRGEYYIIIEAQHDIADFKKGDIEVTNDYWDDEQEVFETIGKDNPTWKVVCWARISHPRIPDDLTSRVVVYFGERVKNNG